MKAFTLCLVIIGAGAVSSVGRAVAADQPAAKPVLLCSLRYHAEGEEQYLPTGNYSEFIERMNEQFDVRVNADAMSPATLKGVGVLLIVNPSEAARGGKTPPHVTERDAYEIALSVQNGGGLVFLSNQTPAHNCEKRDSNRLLAQFGMEVLHFDVGVKEFAIPEDAPIVGGLKWKYIYGCLLDVRPDHFAHPRVIVENDPAVPASPSGPTGAQVMANRSKSWRIGAIRSVCRFLRPQAAPSFPDSASRHAVFSRVDGAAEGRRSQGVSARTCDTPRQGGET